VGEEHQFSGKEKQVRKSGESKRSRGNKSFFRIDPDKIPKDKLGDRGDAGDALPISLKKKGGDSQGRSVWCLQGRKSGKLCDGNHKRNAACGAAAIRGEGLGDV